MRFQSPCLVRVAGRVCGLGFWLLFRTLHKDVRVSTCSPYDATGKQRFLFSVWHDSAAIAAFGGHHTRTVALTSSHRDGSFVASVLSRIGVSAVRGSSGGTGSAATRRLLQVAKTHDIVITPDGPRGPRRTMSRGIVYMASRTGNPIVPTAFACERAWEIPGSWTTQLIPKPFSHVFLLAGDPITIPANIDRSEIENFRRQLQSEMDALQNRAAKLLASRSRSMIQTAAAIPVPKTESTI